MGGYIKKKPMATGRSGLGAASAHAVAEGKNTPGFSKFRDKPLRKLSKTWGTPKTKLLVVKVVCM